MSETEALPSLDRCRDIRPEIVSLRAPLVARGHLSDLRARTEHMSFRVMCYAPGIGENRMHAHLEEDHIFVVMEGEAQFSTLDGPLPVVGRHRAIVLPKGCFYRFSNPGSGPLVLLRFGAAKAISEARARIDPDGRPIGGRSTEDGAARPTVIENAFFE